MFYACIYKGKYSLITTQVLTKKMFGITCLVLYTEVSTCQYLHCHLSLLFYCPLSLTAVGSIIIGLTNNTRWCSSICIPVGFLRTPKALVDQGQAKRMLAQGTFELCTSRCPEQENKGSVQGHRFHNCTLVFLWAPSQYVKSLLCRKCGETEETVGHVLFDCRNVYGPQKWRVKWAKDRRNSTLWRVSGFCKDLGFNCM